MVTSIQEKHEACSHCAPAPGELIHVDCASHVYPDGSIGIHDMCFRVLEHEVVALCGPNGSGKSTLIEHLNGLLQPSSGRVAVMGKKIGLKAGVWREVGVVFQRSDDQLFAPTVLDDVMFGPVNMGMGPEQAREAAVKALAAVGAESLAGKMPGYLSGGQKRLVSIAGVLAMGPKVIAMDEPTSDLDPRHAGIVEGIIADLRAVHGISVVIATHDLDLAARLADRVCIVKGGSIIAEGTPPAVFYDKALLASAGLEPPRVVQLFDAIRECSDAFRGRSPTTARELTELVTMAIKGER